MEANGVTHSRIETATVERNMVAALRQHMSVVGRGSQTRTIQFFDTFPWQLWFAGRTLYRIENEIFLVDTAKRESDSLSLSAPIKGSPRFWWQFPDPIAERLKALTKLRALLPRIRIVAVDRLYDVTNQDQKTVVKVLFTAFRVDSSRGPVFLRTCSCVPVRGYDGDFRRVRKTLKENGLPDERVHLLREYFEHCDNWPQPYRIKSQLQLKPDQSGLSATCAAIQALLKTARSTEKGIVADLDTEFLHDYRVSIRSIRALLSQTSGVFAPAVERRLKRGFALLSKKTNRMRDLDVYLLERSRYRKMVPAELESGLDTMFDDFERYRAREHAGLRRYLQSVGYRNHMSLLKRTLEQACRAEAKGVDAPDIGQIAHKKLSKQIRKISKLSSRLDHVTSDQAIHSLRLQCKKLRYSLDFFSSLFPSTRLSKVAKSLRRLQDTLGEFNDLAVQQEALISYYRDIKHADPDLGLAVGVLIGAMDKRQLEVRREVSRLFRKFNHDLKRDSIEKVLRSAV